MIRMVDGVTVGFKSLNCLREVALIALEDSLEAIVLMKRDLPQPVKP